ncbi:bifunctional alpha,alpha-trehalose-phosphate synthase (UDP-forming)/trehalose-phosphatase [Sphingobacterium sp. SGG-5]|uniref:bifunctional alpha,alpha-trehalose-phosphate synthase (UDP-forming)/trehalose-phosphatase n=1 Tax=Sphingobacterium sp. SGG-5 TaxID=2710881 RepID=UPI0013E9B985|nr:bifunctional alpha,alpha-trehalose-phosphate synthase (UDP-forming)/trehalose-phosphatase [Sphingobacterium sp. SGG-5]NGM61715.1 bifunctional alpha,alpha-trehalose-phosphate synthase (UDP-forming)/trehalose-phosphatase [Sphingobacterium sp. SGG-5]
MSKKRTIIISNRLPIRIEKRDGVLHFIPSEGGLATGLGSIYKQKENVWVGWPGYIPEDEEEKRRITDELEQLNLIPVFLNEEEIQGYYEGFSNEILWPIFHYILSYAVFNKEYWMTYKHVNTIFCEAALRLNLTLKDEIWIHDYQLMLLPQLIRQHHELLSIGYFQHIPFPADEIFRCIPWRDELLEGLLGADLVAFHTYNDAQHFLNACIHILGLSYTNNSVQVRDRQIFIEVFPMGIDFDKFDTLAQDPSIHEKSISLKEHFHNRKIILSIDRLDYSKGIIERLQAYENLLQLYPELRDKVVLYMLVVPSRDTVPQYKALLDEVDRMVGHINAVYGFNEWTPIAYFYNSLPVEELSALYVAADICLVTSLRDGMNLVCKEYVASKAQSLEGVLILSELAGAAKELTDSILINPNAIDDITYAIHLAIHMPLEEQRKRMEKNVEIVKKFNIYHWVKIFFLRLREIKSIQHKRISRKIHPELLKKLMEEYQSSQRRIFFLDYDGTLVGFKKDAEKAQPTDRIYKLLDALQQPSANQIVIISGRSYTSLNQWFNTKDYFLVAEHGAWSNYPTHQWESKHHLTTRWKTPVKRIMDKFVNLTPGALIEEKSFSLAWHYRRVQTGLGQMRSQELIESLRYLLPQYDLQLLNGDKVIEIKSNALNKGKSAMDIVRDFNPDFIFAIGDDSTDEDMFYELPDTAVTVKVGNKNSAAKYYVETQEDAVELIDYFVQQQSENE